MGEPFWRRYQRFFHADVARDVDQELRYHLDRLTEDEMTRAGNPREARARAEARFGDVAAIRDSLAKTGSRRIRKALRADLRDAVLQDARYALRRLRQEPGFAVTVLLVLGLGIGAATAMFSAVDAALLRPIPFERPDRLLELPQVGIPFQPEAGERESGPRVPDLLDIRDMPDVFEQVAGYAAGGLNLSDPDHPVRVNAGIVTAEFFATLGVRPAWGRGFVTEEGVPGAPRVAVLSDGLWRRQFGSGPVLGHSITLNNRQYTVIGIMPPGFSFPSESDLWIPMTVPTTFETFEPFRGWLPSQVIARVRDGVSVEAAAARSLARWEQVASTPGQTAPPWLSQQTAEFRRTGAAIPLQRDLAGSRRTALLVLLGATGLLLLIACANVTHLLLSRASTRAREMAMRTVLGATRGRLLRQLLTESVMLGVGAAALGLAVAPLALRLTNALMPPALAGLAPPRVDLRVLGFAVGIAVITSLVFGLWPAFTSARTDAAETIKSGGRGATAGGAGRARRLLVAGELALTLVLLVGAGLMLRSFERLVRTDSGLHPERVATLELSFALSAGGRAARLPVIDAALQRLAGAPGVEAAGAVNDLPLRGGPGVLSITFQPEGRAQSANEEPLFARYLICSGSYFRALGIPLLQGRTFTTADDSLAPHVAIVNATMARTLWPEGSPLGRVLRLPPHRPGGEPTPYRVVGVVGDVRETGIERDAGLQMYFPMYAETPANVALVARGTLPPAALLGLLREAVRSANPTQPVYNVRMMEDVVSASIAPRRINTMLISAFGALALILAALGVYGVVAYSVSQRMRELGIRAALGATGDRLVRLIAGEMLWVAILAVALGLAGAWASARVLRSLLYGVTVRDPGTYAVALLVLLVTLAAGTLWPARRALRLNPMDVIRAD